MADKPSKAKIPMPPKVKEMAEETEELLYIATALQKRARAYVKKLSHLQNTNSNPMVRQAARAQYSTMVHGGRLSVDKAVTDLEKSQKSIERAVKNRIGKYVRNAALLQLAKATTTKGIADAIRDYAKTHPTRESKGIEGDVMKLSESTVPNLQDIVGKEQLQSDIPGIVEIAYSVDYQNPENFDEITLTIIVETNGRTFKQTVSGWDEAFELMNNLESGVADAYREGLQNMLIDLGLLINGDPDYENSATATDDMDAEERDRELAIRMDIDHDAMIEGITGIVSKTDEYVFDAVSKEIKAMGFVSVTPEE